METTYRITNRGGKGVKTINITEKTGALVGLLLIEESEDLMITRKSGVVIRMKVSSIRETGRAAQGVKLLNLEANDQIAAIARIQEQMEEDEEILDDEEQNNENNETSENEESNTETNTEE